MKKQLLLTLLLPLLVGCGSSYDYIPKYPYPGENDEDDNGDNNDSEEALPMTVYFYLDYSHSEDTSNDIKNEDGTVTEVPEYKYKLAWKMLTPLGSCPEEAKLTDADASDPLYPHFLGYSMYPTCLDESKLWNFETDYYQGNILNLYGVWVAQERL